MKTKGDYFVTVCDRCNRASCWHGEFYCDDARDAGTVEVLASQLRREKREHPDNYSREKIRRVCGAVKEAKP